jgi:hypothetical protein
MIRSATLKSLLGDGDLFGGDVHHSGKVRVGSGEEGIFVNAETQGIADAGLELIVVGEVWDGGESGVGGEGGKLGAA